MKWSEDEIRRAAITEAREYWRAETDAKLSSDELRRLQKLHDEYHERFDEFDTFQDSKGLDKIAAELITPEVGAVVKHIYDRNTLLLTGIQNLLKRLRDDP